ncbi:MULTISPECIES: bifunctional 4-hydroxy-2-oxoglutarate aldolase/2-dehydro-3-deoxy-phosphogluconate aldolase [unclassified Streptomyces]|uniref:bifunctional 4-hydroxy-2-oxoglutarate aldolase/2-dehydro-3-deoxy-phosphogluconate aldolase n=1 Tax=unclassified Streptomyces TaxID=2593676 RepID=UPI000223B7FE|nr:MULTISPECIES: bifunctional 4-hydroxy-2-oxoglutarate aldolase/2-dehydro-3-deoxy-phosphogluconate aldolase [unclassified Streptomyces]MYR67141.1 bifunctional 4-hydroxy-2-oxoglutarate aldolase/2-dehydro-3-deoxy-phosphogluconate aldolase [Streptomyces sp. SID4939]MYR99293.1 bifunctional 4-hydroxy-2-oxoglutarate aldolase/2-dehydro-3-deoxy-phosphogluconate aldolase [Streptomyces sp. SID4940]MYT67689.1 bifunctional 4-hydroxy-2-oxoglutarate aldolase/2-dehydro-3-deoxy-phosphogluconate aldolase [Strept
MDLLPALRTHRIVAIVRGADPDAALRTVLTLAEERLALIEVSLSGQDALGVIRRARAALGPGAPLGAGTVLTAQDARAAHDAGADFVVTPAVCESVTEAKRLGLPVLAGVMTPTDVVAAQRLGADAFKLFPAAQAGGPGYLKALHGPFPDAPFVPVGGVDADAARTYLAHGAAAVGVGSPLIGDAADGGDLDGLRERARAFLGAVRATAAADTGR